MPFSEYDTSSIGWYGKIPTAGDFIQRRLPNHLVNRLAHWFQNGLTNLQHKYQMRIDDRGINKTPIWNFVLPATLGIQAVQMGCLQLAHDRVGRAYPVCAIQFVPLAQWDLEILNQAGEWYRQLGYVLLSAMRNEYSTEQLDNALLMLTPVTALQRVQDDILSILNAAEEPLSTLGWQQVTEFFAADRYTSFWWTSQIDGYPLHTHIHSGNFNTQLFSQLFEPIFNTNIGRHGLYPKMFE